jgi:hypothetical protein
MKRFMEELVMEKVKNNEIVLGLKNLFKMAMRTANYAEWYRKVKEGRESKKHIHNLINKANGSIGFKSMDAVFDEETEVIKINRIPEDIFEKPIIKVVTKKALEYTNFTSLIALAIAEDSTLAYTKMENYHLESKEFEYEVICEGQEEVWDGLKRITGLTDYYDIEEAFESAVFIDEFENSMIVEIAGKEYVIAVL